MLLRYTKLLLLILPLALLISYQCKKEEAKVTVKGKVIDALTSLPVAGAHVSVYKHSHDLFTAGGNLFIADVITDADGNFSFPPLEVKHISVWKKNYFFYETDYTPIESSLFNLMPQAYLRVHIKNVTKNYNCISLNESEKYYGLNLDTIPRQVLVVHPQTTVIPYWVKDSLELDFHPKSLTLPSPLVSFDTTSVDLKY